MKRIMLVSVAMASFERLTAGLCKIGCFELIHLDSKAEALKQAKNVQVDIVIVDKVVADADGLELIRELTQRFPLINCALVSVLPPEKFHELTEGLGVFMQLPPLPGEAEMLKMIDILNSINVLLKTSKDFKK